MFELGYAIAKKKDIIIISQALSQDQEKIPFDILGIRRLPYQNSWHGIEDLMKTLKGFIKYTIDLQKQRKNTGKKLSSKKR